MSRVLVIKLNMSIVNPTIKTLNTISNILVQNPSSVEINYKTIDSLAKPNIDVPPIKSPVNINGSIENLILIQRLLKSP